MDDYKYMELNMEILDQVAGGKDENSRPDLPEEIIITNPDEP